MLKSYISYGMTIFSSGLFFLLTIISEVLYPNESDLIPIAFEIIMLLSFFMTVGSIAIGCKFRNQTNTSKKEYIFEWTLVFIGFIIICIFAVTGRHLDLLLLIGLSFIFVGFISILSTMMGLSMMPKDNLKIFSKSLNNEFLKLKKALRIKSNNLVFFNEKERLLEGENYIPYRIKISENSNIDISTDNIKYMYYCLLTRNYNGMIRENYLNEILNSNYPNWVIPYIVKASSDYVKEIVILLYKILKDKDNSKLKKYCFDNKEIIRYYYSVMISYWNLYYRIEYPNYKNYPGYKLFVECFDFKKKYLRYNFEEQDDKWNKMWDLYSKNNLKRNHLILCDYYSGVNGEGHFGFFFNNEDNLKEYINVLKKILPNKMKVHLIKAYDLYLNDEEFNEADKYFFEHEYEIMDLLEDYSNMI